MILTRAAIDALQVSHKCWSRQQFILLGVPFPPEKGWLKRMEGKFVTPETHQQLQQLCQKAKPPCKTPTEIPQSTPPATPKTST